MKSIEIMWPFRPWWYIQPFGKDEIDGKWGFIWPKFKIEILRGKPCETSWLWDWIVWIGWLSIWKKNISAWMGD